jgi:hypothetical protein
MSIENKIKELLERTQTAAQDSADDTLNEAEQAGAASVKKDTSITAANAGDATQAKQGSSEDASFESRDEGEANQGAKVSKDISKNTLTTKGDAKSVKTQAMEETQPEAEVIAEDETQEQVDVRSELDSIFGEELSEEFRTKAASIFEAAVIARTNHEVQKIVEELGQQNEAEMAEYKEGLVEKVDAYLNYVVENWMQENELAIENGLRTEVAEDFIQGLKVLFKEHYVEVPEEKYDVIGELQSKAEGLEAKLNEAINSNVELNKEVVELKRNVAIEEATKDLAATEAEKLAKLVEGVEFESEELFKEKLAVIKENYFPKGAAPTAEETLTEEVVTGQPNLTEANDTISAYAKALSRSVKR